MLIFFLNNLELLNLTTFLFYNASSPVLGFLPYLFFFLDEKFPSFGILTSSPEITFFCIIENSELIKDFSFFFRKS